MSCLLFVLLLWSVCAFLSCYLVGTIILVWTEKQNIHISVILIIILHILGTKSTAWRKYSLFWKYVTTQPARTEKCKPTFCISQKLLTCKCMNLLTYNPKLNGRVVKTDLRVFVSVISDINLGCKNGWSVSTSFNHVIVWWCCRCEVTSRFFNRLLATSHRHTSY